MASVVADDLFMREAIRLSRNGTGYTEPNPLVGAVVVHEGRMISAGHHSRFGAPHAEREALTGSNIPHGAELYVTLEPCTHFGKTPPCLDIILEKKIRRVVVATLDPHPLVSGKGIAALRKAGLVVETGCLAAEAEWVNRHYLTYMRNRRPHLVLKAGMSADGKLTDARGHSRWVTSPEMRQLANGLRAEFSAVMVGVGTVLADNPSLTLRSGFWPGKRLWRIVLDGHGRLASASFLGKGTENHPILWVIGEFADIPVVDFGPHLKVLRVAQDENGRIRLDHLMTELYELGIASVLVEGGAGLADSLLSSGLIDEVILFTASSLIGGRNSLTLFQSGRSIDNPLRFREFSVFELESGWIVRGRV